MSDNIQTTTRQAPPCLQHKIDKIRYLVEVHFSDTSTQSVEDKLKRVILHDLNFFTSCHLVGSLCVFIIESETKARSVLERRGLCP